MDNLIEPNLHPIFVHFVVGLLFTSALALAISAFAPADTRWRSTLQAAGDWMLGLGILAALGAVIAGFDAYYSVAHDGPSHEAMTTHRNWALPTAAAFISLGIWRWLKRSERPGALFGLAGLAAAALLTVTAWWGGALVFRHGLGVESLPAATGEGHDHDHGDGGHGHDETAAAESESEHAHDQSSGDQEHAHDGGTPSDHARASEEGRSPTSAPAHSAPGTPEATALAFHSALASQDEAQVRSLLAEDVLILESGSAERSLEQYASHHMMSDMAFLSSVSRETLSQTAEIFGDMAWVATETVLRGRFNEREIAVKSQESLVMRREGESWIIEHVHWSNSSLQNGLSVEESDRQGSEDEHDHADHDH
ncbi:hypothetical protein GCM10011367_11930 [Marinicauda pacifica]|jgi:uncharacterized membrane protein/ketosteroid isomerase-like protein|uniref:DUF2231 domain-containing protein n=1 Tax=Marinicauda pacifica TaxID=1133559 RepID=A0A4S2HG88_9PROT|nr:DUF2231 domain-containing protein [Marinicauda pacifica]TGY94818.1 DUF2231 domain-containing protein [Marinicauda pacifica]GGE39115.1 hypothetical protein GCM10011367_11930 [Marinicauda pacifica]